VRDYQRQRVYDWENRNIEPKDSSIIPYAQAQMMVNYIWEQEGLLFPPSVREMPKQNRTVEAKANRSNVWVKPEGISSWVLLHELAHSLTTKTFDEDSQRHGPAFVGVYMRLLEKHLRIPLPLLMYSAQKEKVDFDITAKYEFVD